MDFRQSKLGLMTMMRAGAMYPERTATQLKLAETQYILLQYDYAVSTLNKILKYEPLNAEAYFMLGMVFNEHDEDKKKANADRHPLKSIGTAEDMANTARFLLGDDSRWMTGQVISVDGGMGSLR